MPAMPPGATVGAKVPPAANVARSSSESSRLGGALYQKAQELIDESKGIRFNLWKKTTGVQTVGPHKGGNRTAPWKS